MLHFSLTLRSCVVLGALFKFLDLIWLYVSLLLLLLLLPDYFYGYVGAKYVPILLYEKNVVKMYGVIVCTVVCLIGCSMKRSLNNDKSYLENLIE